MNNSKNKRTFFDLFHTDRPALKLKFSPNSDEEAKEIQIKNELDKKIDTKTLTSLSMLCSDTKLNDFVDFYSRYNGFSLGIAVHSKDTIRKALLRQLPVSDLKKFTEQYLPNGRWAWTIDLNKTKVLYRNEQKWLAFAEVDGGPACLTIFLDGENAGNVFLLNPQPHFNTLKPIAKSFTDLLDRIAKDPAAFFKLTRAYVTVIGNDNQNYGYVPTEYIDNS